MKKILVKNKKANRWVGGYIKLDKPQDDHDICNVCHGNEPVAIIETASRANRVSTSMILCAECAVTIRTLLILDLEF